MLAALEQNATAVPAVRYFAGRHVQALDYESPVLPVLGRFSGCQEHGDTITLYPSYHILGSCQVLAETRSGARIAYTGDFGRGAAPIRCNALVLDSTHGGPMFDAAPDPEALENTLIEYVCDEVEKSKKILIRAHRGRLQHTMHLLSQALSDEVRFLAHPTDIKLARAYRLHGMDIRDCAAYDGADGEAIRDEGLQYVEFRTHGPVRDMLKTRAPTAVFNLGGRFLGGGTAIRKNGEYYIEFMDHADYNSIIEYVRRAEPEYVVTDNARGRQGRRLADAIESELGIRAVARPE